MTINETSYKCLDENVNIANPENDTSKQCHDNIMLQVEIILYIGWIVK